MNWINWFSVENTLPQERGRYLVYAPSLNKDKPFYQVSWYEPKTGFDLLPIVWRDAITHWAYLTPPED